MNNYQITDIYLDNIEGDDCVLFTVTTSRGEERLLEWITDGQLEKVDSHIEINQSDVWEKLFEPEEDMIERHAYDTIKNEILLKMDQLLSDPYACLTEECFHKACGLKI